MLFKMARKRKRKRILIKDSEIIVLGRRRSKPKFLREGQGKVSIKRIGKSGVSVGKALKQILPSRKKIRKAFPKKSIYAKSGGGFFGFFKKKNKMLEEFE